MIWALLAMTGWLLLLTIRLLTLEMEVKADRRQWMEYLNGHRP